MRDTALIEAFNLKAAIEYQTKNMEASRDALADMPPRDESELDPVTLHNQALVEMEEKPTEGFRDLKPSKQRPFIGHLGPFLLCFAEVFTPHGFGVLS